MKTKLLLCFILLFAHVGANDIYRQYLTRWEGYSEVVYRCPAGKNTIGIGHNLDAHKQPATTYTKEQIEAFYRNDVADALRSARNGVTNFDSLPDDVKRVTISLIFTVGERGFMGFAKFCEALSKRDYSTAAEEIKNSAWYGQVAKSRAQDHYLRLKTTR